MFSVLNTKSNEGLSLLDYYIVLNGRWLLVFWRSVLPPSSGSTRVT